MDNWKQYFTEKFCAGGQFVPGKEFTRGKITFITFTSSDDNKETTIRVGLLDNDGLLTLEFIDPRTPGFNKHQEREYFYKYDFYSDSSYRGSGVEFNQNNIDHFNKFLEEGLKGREVQYIKNGRIVQADIYQYYGANDNNRFRATVTLEHLNFIERVKILFKSREWFYDKKKEIQLCEIFSGV